MAMNVKRAPNAHWWKKGLMTGFLYGKNFKFNNKSIQIYQNRPLMDPRGSILSYSEIWTVIHSHLCRTHFPHFFQTGTGGWGCQGGSQDLRHRQIWANQDNFLCSSPISVRRTFAKFIFLKLRKLASMFLVFARISSDFGLNSRKSGYIRQKTAKNLHVFSKKMRITQVGCMQQIFDNFGGKLILGPLSPISLLNPYHPPAVNF